jgi:hypothetical protein
MFNYDMGIDIEIEYKMQQLNSTNIYLSVEW